MRRRCNYIVHGAPKGYDGWLIQISVSGSVTFYFVETSGGEIRRLHSAFCELNLVPEDTPFPKEEEK